MKNSLDHTKLVDTALSDEGWDVCRTRLQTEGLAALRAKRRYRNSLKWVGQLAILCVLCVVAWRAINGPRTLSEPQAHVNSIVSNPPEAGVHPGNADLYITEDQMLAMFPKGSCVMAEVNGEKQLVFLQQANQDEPNRLMQ
jgi:hypothetical protein